MSYGALKPSREVTANKEKLCHIGNAALEIGAMSIPLGAPEKSPRVAFYPFFGTYLRGTLSGLEHVGGVRSLLSHVSRRSHELGWNHEQVCALRHALDLVIKGLRRARRARLAEQLREHRPNLTWMLRNTPQLHARTTSWRRLYC